MNLVSDSPEVGGQVAIGLADGIRGGLGNVT